MFVRIRSYSNLTVHRLLDEALQWRDWASLPDFGSPPASLVSATQVSRIAVQCNERRKEAKSISDSVSKLYFISYLNSKFTFNVVSLDARPKDWLDAVGRGPMIEIVVILGFSTLGSVNLMIPRFGLECQLSIRDVAHCIDAKIVKSSQSCDKSVKPDKESSGSASHRALEVQWADRQITTHHVFDCVVVQLTAVTAPRLDFSATMLDARVFGQFATRVHYVDQAGTDI